ncbi:hypothetical protein [Enterococcus caccae]|uniref:Uncharacterized protein n=1 Tax=Enterococcus caccae ATCC BAA-1240 TaxID=1158612 RepID=R3WVD3_9ENTE|nr:hypothetical protein [Enterococcus caccae]EOL45765.1 hypothetical protein UC7_01562 [Enterococcus caccae ATCC BAA-1240]EOT60961.1 hypothetical protein I580_01863 [Enterococcus caccae ATCC BAA-1240]OJG28003.1 hypothetical protein RU98_GL002212 [Enterococcus caccae]
MKEKNIQERLEDSLIEFIERASKKDATPEEIAILPSVATVLVKILYRL